MPGTPMDLFLKPRRGVPDLLPDNTPALTPTAGPYMDNRVTSAMPTRQALADMGLTWIATNPTVGTGVAHAITATFANDTAALFAIQNKEPPGGRNLYLDYLSLWLTAAPAGSVSMDFVVKLFPSKDQTPTANNVAIVPKFTNLRNPAGAILPTIQAFNAGALTVPGSGASALQSDIVGRARLVTGLNIVGDAYQVVFGAENFVSTPGLTAVRASQPARVIGYVPTFPIPPQAWCVIYRYAATEITTAPSFEYQLAGWFW